MKRKMYGRNLMTAIAIFVISLGFGFTGAITTQGAITTHTTTQEPINLLSADNFTILSGTGIVNTESHTSEIMGNIGSSPITAAAMNGVFCPELTGRIYGVDAAYIGSGDQTCFMSNPPLANKTLVDNAVADMLTAYNEAAGKTNPTATELGAGNIGGMTLAPGLYQWSTDVTIPRDLTLLGNENDVWIFQIAGDLNVASSGSVATGIKVLLAGGAKFSNIFWQVGGVTGATLGTYSTFNGTILSAKQIIMQTGAVLYGKALAQTQVTLDANTISTSRGDIASDIGLLTVKKIVINDDGGSSAPEDFEFFVRADRGAPHQFRGSEDGTQVSIAPGRYSALEINSHNYLVQYSEDCKGFIRAGEEKQCIITNNDIPANQAIITVIKKVVNDNGGTATSSDFRLTLSKKNQETQRPSTTTVWTFCANEWDLCSFTGTKFVRYGANTSYFYGTFTDSVDCTNTLFGDPIVGTVKHCDYTDLIHLPTFTEIENFSGNSDGTRLEVDAGVYKIEEPMRGRYLPTYSNDCSQDGLMHIEGGRSYVCTITNNDIALNPITRDQRTDISPSNTGNETGGGGGGGTGGGSSTGGGGSTGGSSVGGGSTGGGITLSNTASTGNVLNISTTYSCGMTLDSYIGFNKENDVTEVKKLQEFLNLYEGENLLVDGFYGSLTMEAVNKFQIKNWEEVLLPWVSHGLATSKTSTGYVYKTTKRWINMVVCPKLDIPIALLP